MAEGVKSEMQGGSDWSVVNNERGWNSDLFIATNWYWMLATEVSLD